MLTGGCQCGALRYRIEAEPRRIYCCHCSECRAQSSSAFGISIIVPVASVALTKGELRTWSRPTTTGKVLECAFCPVCGSRVWHVNAPPGADMSIKGGSLDEPVDLRHAAHIWTISKLPGVIIPEGAEQWERNHD